MATNSQYKHPVIHHSPVLQQKSRFLVVSRSQVSISKNKLGKIMSNYVCVVSLVVSRQCLLLHNMYCRFSIILVLAVGRNILGRQKEITRNAS